MQSAQLAIARPGARTATSVALQTPELSRRTLVRTREARVLWLIFSIIVLSLADLHMTLEHVTMIGMSEGNPLARLIMSTNSPGALVAWKLTSVAAACLAFYAGRKKMIGELAAWFCCGVLIWLTIRWNTYATELAGVCPQVYTMYQADTGLWITMQP